MKIHFGAHDIDFSAKFAWMFAGTKSFHETLTSIVRHTELAAGDIDEFMVHAPILLKIAVKACELGDNWSGHRSFLGVVSGYSPKLGRCVSYVAGALTVEQVNGNDPTYEFSEMEMYCSPGPRPCEGRETHAWPPHNGDEAALRAWAIDALEAERSRTDDFYLGNGRHHRSIGSHIQHVIVGPDGIDSKIIHRWPDRRGYLIATDEIPAVSTQVESGHQMLNPLGVSLGLDLGYMVWTAPLGGRAPSL